MLMEKWNMNNGVDGFAEFYSTHPGCRYDRQTLEEIAIMKIHGFPNLPNVDWETIITMVEDDNFVDMKPKNLLKYAKNNRKTILACARDTWIRQQYARWFEGNDRFLTMSQYHMADEEKLFFNWLIRK